MMARDPVHRVSPTVPFPWHLPVWKQLNRSWQTERFPHAILLQGMQGLGKYQFAIWLSQAILCELRSAELQPCGNCVSCKLHHAGSHPDLLIVKPEEDKQQISVDQIRATNEALSLTSTRDGYRIAVIEPAHQMTISAANSLLKTLEEPNANILIILVSSKPGSLLSTLRSRCQKTSMAAPSQTEAQSWLDKQAERPVIPEFLNYAGGAPLRALELYKGSFESLRQSMMPGLNALTDTSSDLIQVVQAWSDDQLPERLSWLDYWLSNQIKHEILKNADSFTQGGLPVEVQRPDIAMMYRSLDKLRELSEQLRRTSLQRELMLFSILMRIQQSLIYRPTVN